ncbi:hypothetical protein ACO2Q7_09255 [Rathayibacter sp. KR2-224]|uniref:hypothetical protein n=1 Tax=Rathayibacter sp. KR2-224 TaxID=3400913 RepID=UPI003C0F8602
MRFGVKAFMILAVSAAAIAVGALPASATPPGTIGTFPTWSPLSSSVPGTATFASPTDANAVVSTDAATASVASGSSAFLGSNTGFGQDFGSTRAQPYLTLRPKSGSPAPNPPSVTTPAPSTTTVMFGSQPASGWGFAVGDLDADWVFIQPLDASGNDLPTAELGEQGTGNYCDNASPRPSACSGATAPYDVPNWVPGPGSVPVAYGSTTITYSPGTLYGNFNDTSGAYAWFLPSSQVHGIRLVYGALNGSPVYQLWLAQPAPTATIAGTVALGGSDAGQPVPSGTSVELQSADGTPVAALDGSPVEVPVQSDGSYQIVTEQRQEYQLAVVPPAGFDPPAPITVTALASEVTAPQIVVAPTAATQPTPTATATPAAELAESGSNAAPWLLASVAMLVLGGALVSQARRRRRVGR